MAPSLGQAQAVLGVLKEVVEQPGVVNNIYKTVVTTASSKATVLGNQMATAATGAVFTLACTGTNRIINGIGNMFKSKPKPAPENPVAEKPAPAPTVIKKLETPKKPNAKAGAKVLTKAAFAGYSANPCRL